MKFLAAWMLSVVLAGHALAPEPAWKLTWSDEFNQSDGSRPDEARWEFVTGGDGFGNDELETYTSRPDNAHIYSGKLVITATRESYTGGYTSARLQSKGKFSQRYGRFEARIQIPRGQGMWPAFWMLGDDIDKAGWPGCGEIDIMENVGKEPGIVHGTLHGPGYSGGHALTSAYTLPGGKTVADDFHLFAAEWTPDDIVFFVDGRPYGRQSRADIPAGGRWVFDHPFFLLLNLAVGGRWPGNPDASTRFPQQMLVDYVRVYQR